MAFSLELDYFIWGSDICKHIARWMDISQLKASAVNSFRKTYDINKTCQLKPGKGDGIC